MTSSHLTLFSTLAITTIQAAPSIAISTMSIWEIGIKTRKQELFIPGALNQFVEMLRMIDRFRFISVDEKVWMKNVELDWGHKDPADRTILATAIVYD